jgi:hypothetical protein
VKEIKVEVIARAANILGDPHKYRLTPRDRRSLLPCAWPVDSSMHGNARNSAKAHRQGGPIMDKAVVANQEFGAPSSSNRVA